MGDNARDEQVDPVDEHLAGKLFSNIEQPNIPWAFRRFPLPFVDEREDDEETQEALDYLLVCHALDRIGMGVATLYARERWDRGDDKSVCRRRGSRRRGRHRLRMRVVEEMAFDAP